MEREYVAFSVVKMQQRPLNNSLVCTLQLYHSDQLCYYLYMVNVFSNQFSTLYMHGRVPGGGGGGGGGGMAI